MSSQETIGNEGGGERGQSVFRIKTLRETVLRAYVKLDPSGEGQPDLLTFSLPASLGKIRRQDWPWIVSAVHNWRFGQMIWTEAAKEAAKKYCGFVEENKDGSSQVYLFFSWEAYESYLVQRSFRQRLELAMCESPARPKCGFTF